MKSLMVSRDWPQLHKSRKFGAKRSVALGFGMPAVNPDNTVHKVNTVQTPTPP